jgi:predicted Zn-dependent protease
MSRAGYNPEAFVSYLETLARTQDTGSGGMFATHPKASDRIGKLGGAIAKLPRRQTPAVRTRRFSEAIAALGQSRK